MSQFFTGVTTGSLPPVVPIQFTTDSGIAVPAGGNLNVFGNILAAGSTPFETSGAADTVTVSVQIGQAIAATDATKIGLVAFNASQFTVDANGFVSTSSTGVANTITGNFGGPISPTAGNWNILGASVAAGINPVSSVGVGSTLTVRVQTSQALASADATKIGLCNFDSASFTVNPSGFVSLNSSGGFTWNDVSGAFSPLTKNGYFVTGTATGTLPASPSQGDTIKFVVDHATQDLTIDAPGTQLIRIGSGVSSAGGTAVSNAQGDSIVLVYRAADTTWMATDVIGTWTLA